MAKKSFTGIDAFFGKKPTEKTNEETMHQDKEEQKTIEKRTTFILESDLLEKLKALAYWERTTAKVVLKKSLESFFEAKGQKYVEKALEQYRSKNYE